jgi:PHD/YefM family antitoxin component YafN of YafNO toxin-antitoxin module
MLIIWNFKIVGATAVEDKKMTELLAVSAKDVAGKFGYYTDEAMLRPVGIQRHGTTRVVMISLNEYERLLRRDRQVLLTKDLDDETLNAILNAKASERSKALNHLLDDA